VRERVRAKDKEEKMNDKNYTSTRNVRHYNTSSNGVLLDVIKSRKLGTTLHVVIREGQVRFYLYLFFCSFFYLIVENGIFFFSFGFI
jgi:translation initiation factor IF-2